MSIDKMADKFETVAELKQYCNAQHKTITEQIKNINQLNEKVKELEKLLVNSVPSLEAPINKSIQSLSNEEAIAVLEIEKLKELSLTRELDMAECKRYEIYTKTLLAIRNGNRKKDESVDLGEVKESDLLDVLNNNE